MKPDFVAFCRCSSINHLHAYYYDEEVLYITTILNKLPILQRLRNAFKYIFGRSGMWCDFEETVLFKEDIIELKEYLNRITDN